jgi:hypothetical protein
VARSQGVSPGHQTFTDIDALDAAIHIAVNELNAERTFDPLAELRIPCLGGPTSHHLDAARTLARVLRHFQHCAAYRVLDGLKQSRPTTQSRPTLRVQPRSRHSLTRRRCQYGQICLKKCCVHLRQPYRDDIIRHLLDSRLKETTSWY